MTINITVLSVTVSTVPTDKGSYQVADIAYKNNTFQGKVEGKKIMSFGAARDTFSVLSVAQQGTTFDIEIVKNHKGYNDWVKASPSAAASVASSVTQGSINNFSSGGKTASAAPKSTYETPEERAQKQVYIIRQSSISAAVASLGFGAKSPLAIEKVLEVAKYYEDFVFGRGANKNLSVGPSGFDDLPDFDHDFDKERDVQVD